MQDLETTISLDKTRSEKKLKTVKTAPIDIKQSQQSWIFNLQIG